MTIENAFTTKFYYSFYQIAQIAIILKLINIGLIFFICLSCKIFNVFTQILHSFFFKSMDYFLVVKRANCDIIGI